MGVLRSLWAVGPMWVGRLQPLIPAGVGGAGGMGQFPAEHPGDSPAWRAGLRPL